jgi:biotin carboxyl carrier protein
VTRVNPSPAAQRVTAIPPQDGLTPQVVHPDDVRTRAHWIADDQIRIGVAGGEQVTATLARAERTGRPDRPDGRGPRRVEVVVDGWRFELEVEDERRASLRERARRDHEHGAAGGPAEIRAIIPGRVVTVGVTTGDEVEVGDRLFVLEAMKMQNELRAPRAGTVAKVTVGERSTIEVGDVLVVIE